MSKFLFFQLKQHHSRQYQRSPFIHVTSLLFITSSSAVSQKTFIPPLSTSSAEMPILYLCIIPVMSVVHLFLHTMYPAPSKDKKRLWFLTWVSTDLPQILQPWGVVTMENQHSIHSTYSKVSLHMFLCPCLLGIWGIKITAVHMFIHNFWNDLKHHFWSAKIQ